MSTQRTVSVGALRLFALTACFSAGVLLAEVVRGRAGAGLVAAGAVVLGLLVTRARILVAVLAVCLGFALTSVRLEALADAVLAHGGAHGARAVLTGEALTDAREAGGAVRFVLEVREAVLDGDPSLALRERALVTIRPPPEHPIVVGDRLEVRGTLLAVFFEDMDAESRAAARRLTYRGVAARAFASADDVVVLGRSSHPLVRIADAGRRAVIAAAERLPERRAGLLRGITIGDVSRMPVDLDVDFRTTGLSHLVAVSGANVAMVLIVIMLVLRGLRAGRMTTIVLLVATVLCFMAVTRFEPSVMRAGVMAIIALAGIGLGVGRAATGALAAAALVLIVRDPFLIHSAGFQLSILATLGILVLGPRLRAMLPAGKLGTVASVTLGAQLAVAPLLVLHFHRLSIASIAANLLAEPAVAPATILGLLGAAAHAVFEPLGVIVLGAGPFLAWMSWVAASLAQLPLAELTLPAGPAALVFVAAFVASAAAIARGRRPRAHAPHPRRRAPVLVVLVLAANAFVWPRAIAPDPSLTGLIVDMVDVGQGEAIVVRAGRSLMLVDGGPDPRRTFEALRARDIGRIDLLVSTHPHEDHVAGLVPVARIMTIGRVLDPMLETDLASYGAFVDALEHRRIAHVPARAGDSFALGPARVDVLWPPDDLMAGTGSDTNNNSIVLAVTYGADRVLLAGETEEAAQQAMLDAGVDLRADVLKVSHHGSARMVPAFYAATGASHALIPVGDNTYGHPAPETLAALEGMTVWRSDLHGDVAAAIDGDDAPVQVRAQRTARG